MPFLWNVCSIISSRSLFSLKQSRKRREKSRNEVTKTIFYNTIPKKKKKKVYTYLSNIRHPHFSFGKVYTVYTPISITTKTPLGSTSIILRHRKGTLEKQCNTGDYGLHYTPMDGFDNIRHYWAHIFVSPFSHQIVNNYFVKWHKL